MGSGFKERLHRLFYFSLSDTLVSLGILLAVSALCLLLQRFDRQNNFVSMLFVLAVFLIARITHGYFYGIAASLISVLTVNFLFTYPYFRFNFTLAGYPIAIVTMLVVSITTSALTTQAKRSAQARLEADREKTRSNLLRAVSHDLRTPLTSILGVSSALLEHDASISREERLALLRDVHDDASWLIRMVENLLSVTRMDRSGEEAVVKTAEAGEEILQSAAEKFRKRFPAWNLTVSVPQALLMIPMDAILIEQVLMNLMENAVFHASGADCLTVQLASSNRFAVFTVEDNGAGFDPALLPKLFTGGLAASAAADDRRRHMGIGLTVCSAIVRAHGGAMGAENLPGGGARVYFTLPLEED